MNDPIAPNDQAREQNRSVHPVPRSYATHDVVDSTLAGPAAGEVADYADEGETTGMAGQQQGRNHNTAPFAPRPTTVRAENASGQS